MTNHQRMGTLGRQHTRFLGLLVVVSLLLGMVGPAPVVRAAGSVTVDGAVSSGTGLPNASSVSFSHTTGTGTDRLMLVGVSWNCGSTDRTISSITFTPSGGSATSLTEVWTQLYQFTQFSQQAYRYTAIYMLSPGSGVPGTVDIAFSGAVTNGIIAGAANFAGVDQTTPLGTPDGAVGTGNSSSGTPNPAVTLTGLGGDELVFDSVFIGVSNTNHAITADSGQSELWNISGYDLASSFNALGAASTKEAAGTSATMSWTTVDFGSTTTRWAIAAVPINPASDTTDPTVTINQASGQADPTDTPPIDFTVVFNEPVTDFATGDVDLSSSTAPGTLVGTVTEISPNDGTTYNVAVSGMTDSGDVVANIAAGVAHDGAGNPNEASTSTDNVVTYNIGVSLTGSITIVKQANPEGDQEFDFTGDLGAFSLTDDGTLANTIVFADISVGTYAVTETVPSHWWFTMIVCDDPDDETTADGPSVLIDLDADEDITCTFSDQELGSVTFVKQADPEGDQEFHFASSSGSEWSLTDDGTLANTAVFPDVYPGTYAVTETVPAGWTLTDIVCDDPGDGTTVNVATHSALIVVDGNENITCTFTNQELVGSITIVKQADPEGDQEFDFAGDLGAFSLTDDGTLANTQEFTDVLSGTYAISETVPALWRLADIYCDDAGTTWDVETASVLIDLDGGEDITCTFYDESYVMYFPLIFHGVESAPFADR